LFDPQCHCFFAIISDTALSYSSSITCYSCISSQRPHTTALHTLSLHDALPIYVLPPGTFLRPAGGGDLCGVRCVGNDGRVGKLRSEEHTSELQSRFDLVCRLLLEKKEIWN